MSLGPIALDYRKTVPPTVWAQDVLVTPGGFGVMPVVDAYNAELVKREYFTYAGSFPTLTNSPQLFTQTIAIAPDGDFWISSFATVYALAGGLQNTTHLGDLQVVDNNSAYRFFTPSITPAAVGLNLLSGPSVTSYNDWPEPYCVLRGGSLTLTLETPTHNTGLGVLHFAFNGWKEYRNAAI